jgi:tetratricopeptide (TPR) repeat protein
MALALPTNTTLAEDHSATEQTADVDEASSGEDSKSAQSQRTQKLDQLFADLKRERDPQKARRISNRIWAAWGRWDDDAIDLLMRRSQNAMQQQKLPQALDILDQVVALAPNYSEAWNRRATVHFMAGDFTRSIRDVERTLALEPRHYGALTGLAQMMIAMDQKNEAIVALQEALNVYPAMDGPKRDLIRLLEEVQGESL